MSLVDTYTAQATAHDVKKGLANHKVSERYDTIPLSLTVNSCAASKGLLTIIPSNLPSTWVVRWMSFSRAKYYLTGA